MAILLILLSSIFVVAVADTKLEGDWLPVFGIQLAYVFALTGLYYLIF